MFKHIIRASIFAVLAACLASGQSSKPNPKTAASFVGRWEVGLGAGNQTFYITLEKDGQATKTHGSPHGHWTVFADEARISWDDGWHDVIRRAGKHYEKAAYAPGKSFSDPPDNVTGAKNTQPL